MSCQALRFSEFSDSCCNGLNLSPKYWNLTKEEYEAICGVAEVNKRIEEQEAVNRAIQHLHYKERMLELFPPVGEIGCIQPYKGATLPNLVHDVLNDKTNIWLKIIQNKLT